MTDLLQNGIEIYKSGDVAQARKYFISFLKENPQSEIGWKWLYKTSRNADERVYCLRKILAIDPGDQKARQLLSQSLAPSQAPVSKRGNPRPHLLAAGVLAAFFILGACVILSAVLTQIAFYNEQTGSICFSSLLNGKQICYPSQGANHTISDPVLPATTMFAIDSLLPSATPITRLTSTVTPQALTIPSTPSLTPQATSTPLKLLPSNSGSRLPASDWREWPIVPELSLHAQQILLQAASNPNLDTHTFSKVGDCQMVAGIFLAGYTNGTYDIPTGMAETVQWFGASMAEDNITAVNGYGINTVLDPAYGLSRGYTQCLESETPLDCELRTRRPVVVMIGMGTNWIPNGEHSFERYLRQVVDKVLATGALPILATKADNVEGNWKLNEVIARVASEYDLPLVNVWLSVQDLPNHGLQKPPRQVYLTGDGWMKRNHAWLFTLEKVRQILYR
jgi:hypothetical protein